MQPTCVPSSKEPASSTRRDDEPRRTSDYRPSPPARRASWWARRHRPRGCIRLGPLGLRGPGRARTYTAGERSISPASVSPGSKKRSSPGAAGASGPGAPSGPSPASVLALGRFSAYFAARHPGGGPEDVTRELIEAYVSWLGAAGLPRSRAVALVFLRVLGLQPPPPVVAGTWPRCPYLPRRLAPPQPARAALRL